MVDVASKLEKFANDTEKDVGELKERYQEKLAEAKEFAEDDLSDDEIKEFAVGMVRSEVMREDRTSSYSGEVVEIPTLTLGHGGVRRWGRNNPDTEERDILFGYGIVNPEDHQPGAAVFIFDETDGVDLGDMRAKFRPLNEVKVWATLDEGDIKLSGDDPSPTYVCWSSDKTKAEEGDFEDLPDSKAGKRKVINNIIEDAATLTDIGDHISVTDSDDFSHEADLKRFRGYVTDHYQGESKNTGKPFGIYNLLDDTIVDPNDLPENITGGDDRTSGLTAWTQPDLMEHGNDSQCDFYGTITVNDNGDNKGQVQMNVVGIVPYISKPIDDSYGNGGGDEDDDAETTSLQ